jgi:hypothetical protein
MLSRPILAVALLAATLLPATLRSEEIEVTAAPAVMHTTSTPWRAVVSRGTNEPRARARFTTADPGRLAVKVSRGPRAADLAPEPASEFLRVLQESCTPMPFQRAEAEPVPRARVVSLEF